MKTPARAIGDNGEDCACKYLISKSYKILDRNFFCKAGELDIISLSPDNETIVFVEVKTRSSLDYGYPYEFVNNKKQRRLIITAEYYLKTKGIRDYQLRFDIIEILNLKNGTYVRHIENVFDFS